LNHRKIRESSATRRKMEAGGVMRILTLALGLAGLDSAARAAAHQLHFLMREARLRKLTGVALKEDAPRLEG
jgi:hypothetical protein